MNPDFTLIWPLSCPKDGVHLWMRSGLVDVTSGSDVVLPTSRNTARRG